MVSVSESSKVCIGGTIAVMAASCAHSHGSASSASALERLFDYAGLRSAERQCVSSVLTDEFSGDELQLIFDQTSELEGSMPPFSSTFVGRVLGASMSTDAVDASGRYFFAFGLAKLPGAANDAYNKSSKTATARIEAECQRTFGLGGDWEDASVSGKSKGAPSPGAIEN